MRALLAVLVQPAIGCRRHVEDRFESLIEATLLLIATVQGNCLDGIIRLQQSLGGSVDSLMDNISMNGRVNQFTEAYLQFLPVNIELAAKIMDGVSPI